jgi:membrane fusion protein (multidrug efflux system)
VSPIVDPQTGTFKITVEIVDESRRIKPGMFGRISVVYDVHENALQIPRSAIVEETDSLSVFVVEDGLAVRKTVTTGYGNRGMIEIVSGIEDGEQVVTVGQVSLKQDSKVTVINQTDAGELAAETVDADSGQQGTGNASAD